MTVLALGVLVALTPYLLEMLGFAELGIVRGKSLTPILYQTNQSPEWRRRLDRANCVTSGSWAALWQARYAGFVPKGSLFSFLQRMGMVWGKGVLASCNGEHNFRSEGVVDAWTKEPVRKTFLFDLGWSAGFDDGGDESDEEDEWRTSFNA